MKSAKEQLGVSRVQGAEFESRTGDEMRRLIGEVEAMRVRHQQEVTKVRMSWWGGGRGIEFESRTGDEMHRLIGEVEAFRVRRCNKKGKGVCLGFKRDEVASREQIRPKNKMWEEYGAGVGRFD